MASTINASTVSGIVQSADTSGVLALQTGGTTALSIDTSQNVTLSGNLSAGNLSFNSGFGSVATAYGCRAWVNFNGTGTVAIRASGNVSSITDNGVGDYTVNFASALPDANYVMSGSAAYVTSNSDHLLVWGTYTGAGGPLPTASGCRVGTVYAPTGNTQQDCSYVTVMIVR